MTESSSIYMLVFAIGEPVRSRLAEAAFNCYRTYNLYLASENIGYHVMLRKPFKMSRSQYNGLLSALKKEQKCRLCPARILTKIGTTDGPERYLYFGGQTNEIEAVVSVLNDLLVSLGIESKPIGLDPIPPHCVLARGLEKEHEELCAGIFSEVLPTDGTVLDRLVLYEKVEDGWLYDHSLKLCA